MCAAETHELWKNKQSKESEIAHSNFQMLSSSITSYKDVYFFSLEEIMIKQEHANYLLPHNYATNSHYCKYPAIVIPIQM